MSLRDLAPRLLRTSLVLVLFVGVAHADELRLRNGSKVSGKVLERTKERIKFQSVEGVAWYAKKDVLEIVRGKAPWELYAEWAGKLRKQDASGHLALAEWCHRQGLRREARDHAMSVLKIDKDQAEARALLGQVRVGEDWLPREVAMRVLGKQWHEGAWEDAAVVARKQAKADRAREARRFQSEVNRYLGYLSREEAQTRRKALAHLQELADARKMPQLRRLAEDTFARFDAYWRRRGVVAGRALVQANLQHAQLVRLRPYTTSLGSGTPVRFELPELRRVSVGTTVGVPIFGR